MIPDNYQVIEDYLYEPTNEDKEFQLLSQGIKVVRELTLHDEKQRIETMILNTEHVPLLHQLLAHGYLLRRIEEAKTYRQLKSSLDDIQELVYSRHPIGSAPYDWNEGFVGYLDELRIRIRDQQKAEKALEESVVCACRPIVPYTGTLKKPFSEELLAAKEENVEAEVEPAHRSWCNAALVNAWNFVQKTMREMVMEHRIVDDLLLNADMIYSEDFKTTDLDTMRTLARNMNDNPKFANLRSVIAYMCWVYIHFYLGELGKLQNSADAETDMFVLTKDLTMATFQDVFNKAMSNLPATESELEDELDNYDMIDRFSKSTAPEDEPDVQDMFDLNKALSFIYTHKQYRANRYTNMAFMRMANIGGYTYYNEFLVIQPKADDGTTVNYLYIPLIDDLNGSRVCVLKLWRSGTIDILSQGDYDAETGAVSG